MFITNTVLGGAGFSVPPGGEYQRTAAGYPLTLEKTLAKPPESITVYGASGGVGDKTINPLNPDIIDQMTQVGTYNIGHVEISVEPNTQYTMWTDCPEYGIRDLSASAGINNRQSSFNSVRDGVWLGQTRTVTSTSQGKLWIFTVDIINPNGHAMRAAVDAGYKFMLVKGEYTAETIPSFEPYGYKIPIVISDGAATKTINLYSDAALGAGDSLEVSPTDQTASRGGTDLKSLQDWTQDFTIPKADELTVTAGTEIAPSSMEIAYYSSKKG